MANHANVNIADQLSATALHRAASQGNTKIVKLLLEKGERIDVNARDASGNTPLYVYVNCC
jgi:ankyrin repeat protein